MTARILVADGVATTRITLKVRLAAACYDVVTAASAAQILDLLQQDLPDLIVLGGSLPDACAIDICRRLTSEPRSAGIPVLMLARTDRRLAALQAGAAAALDPEITDQMLLARVRGILRDADLQTTAELGLAEAPAVFDAARVPQIVLVADSAGRALRWRQLLAGRLAARYDIRGADEALVGVRSGAAADVYIISADLEARGDGLRLLSELRSRQGSRDAGFVVTIAPEREEMAAIALDLGAGDVLPETMFDPAGIETAAMAIGLQLSRKSRCDLRREEVKRHLVWAHTDPLTGLYNRRYALPKLSEIARDAIIDGRDFSVIAVDLDHFKTINDRHGHAAGDAVLTDVAQRLKAALGAEGFAARIGGEEFLLALPAAGAEKVQRIAERVRLAIQDLPIELPRLSGGGSTRVTASIGVVAVAAGSHDNWPDELARRTLERADRALMAAKASGRNRIVVSQADIAA
ncbi:diguanylate cyclase [Paracoccus tibetensis]|uniref:diguanylate cyclase n=1 Tax=Paracoccus tibetensis TaxID=336292 RepID=A0A1G5H9M1_9RHOB|nr:diguanylate cyclase [Paracoccus tibetensis]SCY60397.1 two-component system, cell cycle response regulator [Paracoccus tibetensis]